MESYHNESVQVMWEKQQFRAAASTAVRRTEELQYILWPLSSVRKKPQATPGPFRSALLDELAVLKLQNPIHVFVHHAVV